MSVSSESLLVRLLRRARAGDAAARDELFAKCRNYVGLVARAQVESWMQAKVDASDLVQQTLLEAHRGFARFEGNTEGEWLAWLKQILAHNAQDFVRRYRTDKRHAGREVTLQAPPDGTSGSFFRDPPDAGESPSQMLVQQEREIELADAIAQLSPDHQEVIMLRNLQRLPFDEVARRMGRTRPAVQMLWMRALRKLEELMRESTECP
jgi:RNA polymerase sigma-70 factor (ECF subfamily)